MAKLDSADDIHDDDDNQFFHCYLSRTSSIAGNGKREEHKLFFFGIDQKLNRKVLSELKISLIVDVRC